jgi:hypothetical protein
MLRGDQVHPRVALNSTGGYLVWQDNATDSDGSGIGALPMEAGLSPGLEPFRVNIEGEGDQENPAVALLDGGGAVFVWQSSDAIRGRVLGSDGLFTTAEDIVISAYPGTPKINPVVVALNGGGALVVWSSFGQDDADNFEASGGYRHLQGVFGQRLDARGARIGSEFQLNIEVRFNQRNPALARLSSGQVVAAWVSERGAIGLLDGQVTDRIEAVEIKGRLLDAAGEPAGGEFLLSESGVFAASPSLSASGNGFVAAWCEGDMSLREIGYQIMTRTFAASGAALIDPVVVNTHWYGDQVAPAVARIGEGQLIVWSSFGQDGSRDGVFGQFMAGGQKVGSEFRVNTTTVNRQIHPQVVARGDHGYFAVWSSYVGSPGDFELFGQRYGTSMPQAPTPVVSALSANRLGLAWPPIGGYDHVEYLVYMDGQSEPDVTPDFYWNSPATLQPSRSYSFRLAYRLPGGAISPLSGSVTGTTWGTDENFDGLPDDWQQSQWGADKAAWPPPTEDSDGDGMTNRDEFLAGTDPRNSGESLRTGVMQSPHGPILTWNTTPGQVYQVQESGNLKEWKSLAGARFARSSMDQVAIEHSSESRYYRVIRLR